ncbi:3-Phosphoinositide-Dependent Protein Kinase 2-Like [Manis pentadactyla]|nr:3-Phosphoinositide-Dependent Protein Kinase 2-Like [Manis pentadactyla]
MESTHQQLLVYKVAYDETQDDCLKSTSCHAWRAKDAIYSITHKNYIENNHMFHYLYAYCAEIYVLL